MEAGKLDRRIFFDRPAVAQDDTGQEVETWVPSGSAWASWRRASARETLAAAEVSAAVTDVFEIRWSSQVADIDPKWCIVFGERVYDIVEVTEIGRRVGLKIAASARADG